MHARPGPQLCSGSMGPSAPHLPHRCLGHSCGHLFLLENRHFSLNPAPHRGSSQVSVCQLTERLPSVPPMFLCTKKDTLGPGGPAWRWFANVSNERYLDQSILLLLERRLFASQSLHLLQHTVTHWFNSHTLAAKWLETPL